MRTVTVHRRQTLWDVAVERCGSADAALEIALMNGMAPTDRPACGSALLVPDPVNHHVAGHYASKGVVPATAPDDSPCVFEWSGASCVQHTDHYGYEWTDPECTEAEPCILSWEDAVCILEEGPYRHRWSEAECATAPTEYMHGWSGPVCAREEPHAFSWGDALCIQAAGPHAFSWSEGVCAEYQDYDLVWDPLPNGTQT